LSRVSFTQFKEHFRGEVYWLVAGAIGDRGRDRMVALAGAPAVRLLADLVGLTAALSVALTRRRFLPS
jgi:hypothetical protein